MGLAWPMYERQACAHAPNILVHATQQATRLASARMCGWVGTDAVHACMRASGRMGSAGCGTGYGRWEGMLSALQQADRHERYMARYLLSMP